MRWVVLAFVLAAATPAPASAVTLDEVVVLSKSGVSEAVIVALIERDQTLFSISADQLVRLQREGVSDVILIAMLKSGKQDPTTPAQAVANTVVGSAASPAMPDVLIVGHGPERPNTLNGERFVVREFMPIPIPVPYVMPYRGHRLQRRVEPALPPFEVAPQQFCVSTTHAGVPPLLSPITECSPVMPPAPRPR